MRLDDHDCQRCDDPVKSQGLKQADGQRKVCTLSNRRKGTVSPPLRDLGRRAEETGAQMDGNGEKEDEQQELI